MDEAPKIKPLGHERVQPAHFDIDVVKMSEGKGFRIADVVTGEKSVDNIRYTSCTSQELARLQVSANNLFEADDSVKALISELGTYADDERGRELAGILATAIRARVDKVHGTRQVSGGNLS